MGILLGLHFWDFLARLERFAQRVERVRRVAAVVPNLLAAPPGFVVAPLWHAAANDALRNAQGPLRLVVQRLVEDGEPALELSAAANVITKRAALGRVFGEQVVRVHVASWGLL